MTVVEVLVAIAIFSILALIVSTVFCFAAYNNLMLHRMNKQMDAQTENVENQNGGNTITNETFEITFGDKTFECEGKKVIVGNSDDRVQYRYFAPDVTP